MHFLLMSTCFSVVTGLLTESILTLLIFNKLKNTRPYIFKFLTSNTKITLETYVMKRFFPNYFFGLGLLFFSTLGLGLSRFGTYYSGYLCVLLFLVFLRVYNRNIFSNLWELLTKLSYRE